MKENIIYIDDEQANLDGFRMVFGDEYNIFLATTAKEVYQLVKENQIKVLISDQRMPEITGLDLCVRVDEIDHRIVCIMLTAYADIGVTVQAINQGGIYRFMLKPWKREEMKIAIDNAIDKYNLKNENERFRKDLEDKNSKLESIADALKKSESKQKAMISNISDVIGIINKEGKTIYKSPNITELFGWLPEDLIGLDAWETVHPYDLDRIKREFYHFLNEDFTKTTVEYRYKYSNQVKSEPEYLYLKEGKNSVVSLVKYDNKYAVLQNNGRNPPKPSYIHTESCATHRTIRLPMF